jgi:hypothetical protein
VRTGGKPYGVPCCDVPCCAAERNHRTDNGSPDETNEFHREATSALLHTTACTAAEAGDRLPGGGMTGQCQAGVRTKTDRV